MRRLLTLGALVVAALSATPLAPVSQSISPPGVSAQVVERVTFRKPPPSCQQAIKDLGLEGQPVSCEEPPAPTYDPPQMHGKYRLFPGSYVGPLTYENSPDTAPPGVVSDDLDTIKASSMYVDPAWLPDGYSLSSINTNGYDSEHVILATYVGPGDSIHINHVRRSEWPVDVIQPVGDSPVVYETLVLGGVAAVLSYPKSGSSSSVEETLLRFAEGDVDTIVVGDHLGPEAATQIGLSLVCGASCVSSPQPTARVLEGGVSGSSVEAEGAGLRTGTLLGGEHRVIAGLAITDVEVVCWWGGVPCSGYWHGSDYGEAALDLARPGDPWTNGTIGTAVYVTTWRWSGNGVLRFKTRDYSISTACTGRYVDLKDAANNALGSLTYVHLDSGSMQPEYDTWTSNPNGWTIRYVGNVAGSQPNCSWEAPHVHQGQTTSSPSVFHNTAVPDSQGRINPSNPTPPSYNWMFKVTLTQLVDSDGDGCSDSEEAALNFNPQAWYDVYDVPVPAYPDPTPNGPKNRKVDIADALAVLFYFGARDNQGPNGYGVDYDSDKNGDAVEDGVEYDRTPGPYPNPPNDAGPPNGTIDISDALVALKQFGLDCRGGGAGREGGGTTLLSAPNAMAVDVFPGGGVDSFRIVTNTQPFDVDIVISAAGEQYLGYQASLAYNDQVLEFIPTQDVDSDTVAESWTYTGLGGATHHAVVSRTDADGDTVVDRLAGGSLGGSGTETGAVARVRLRCLRNGGQYLHLVGDGETTTVGEGGDAIETQLSDAWLSCWVN